MSLRGVGRLFGRAQGLDSRPTKGKSPVVVCGCLASSTDGAYASRPIGPGRAPVDREPDEADLVPTRNSSSGCSKGLYYHWSGLACAASLASHARFRWRSS